MQHHDKMRKNNRLRNAPTPERPENRLMDYTAVSVSSPRRKNSASGRQSVISQTGLNSTALNLRKMEIEHNNLELELAYGEYIQSMAELVIAKKKLKETETIYGKTIKNLSAEVKSLEEKCHVLEERNNNIKLLSNVNNYEEAVQNHLKDIEKEQKKFNLQNILSDLEKLLSKFNVLRCDNIQLPTTPSEMMEFKETLKNCLSVLQKATHPIECETLENLSIHTEEFAKLYQEISQIKKIIEGELCHLQSEVLCKCSNIFSHDNDNTH